MADIINLEKLRENQFFEQENAVIDSLLEMFIDCDVVAEAALVAVALYLGMAGSDGREQDWHTMLDEFVACGREIRANNKEAQ